MQRREGISRDVVFAEFPCPKRFLFGGMICWLIMAFIFPVVLLSLNLILNACVAASQNSEGRFSLLQIAPANIMKVQY